MKTFSSGSADALASNPRGANSATFQDRVRQAETCCEQARAARRQRRYRAASGLFSTAATLYSHATMLDDAHFASIEHRLSEIESEMALCAEMMRQPGILALPFPTPETRIVAFKPAK